MMQQNLVSGETKLADYWLLVFKITCISPRSLPEKVAPDGGLPNTRWWIPDGSRMVPRYLMAPDSSLLGTGLKKASCLWLTYVYLSYPAWLHHIVYIQI
jgi:hypothetical protein